MFLIKCKCGCFFTIKAESLKTLERQSGEHKLCCPNCAAEIPLGAGTEIGDAKNLAEATQSVSYIPDHAKITVTFEP